MDLSKSFEYFNPIKANGVCHILGCGSVGSTIAENLARLGITKFALYDFDKVEAHNIVNQMFVAKDVGRPKVEATKDIITSINPEAEKTIQLFPEGWKGQPLSGYVFLCVDNIDLRREICKKNRANLAIKVMFDFRTTLEEGQHYAAVWQDMKAVNNLIKSMEFSHEEAKAVTPVSACGVTLGVAPTVRAICSLGVCNFVNYIKTSTVKPIVICNPFQGDIY